MLDGNGAWVQRPGLTITHVGGAPATQVVIEVILSGRRWDWRGYIINDE